ncbi:hypothetical protein E2986_13208 [Frieseomelitta varia]|uniref:Uncharacterized protein n=1 Tax=Frieseomelitta varia TaxID=561572 RepID=A0A833S224_9HYME|nr:hypothetical protein E2986_13208 [Frieseomelitta varia]
MCEATIEHVQRLSADRAARATIIIELSVHSHTGDTCCVKAANIRFGTQKLKFKEALAICICIKSVTNLLNLVTRIITKERQFVFRSVRTVRMRQVVVLEPAGSVLVIRQTSLGSNVATGNTNSNAGSNNAHETHGLANHAAVSTIASNDHNQNRIVVVRSSSSTCMTTTFLRCNNKVPQKTSNVFHQADNHSSANGNNINVNGNLNGNTGAIGSKTSTKVVAGSGGSKSNERNDHLRNDHKSQDGIGTGESNSGCRPRTSKEAAHENVSLDRKLDGADPISERKQLLQPRINEFLTSQQGVERANLVYKSTRKQATGSENEAVQAYFISSALPLVTRDLLNYELLDKLRAYARKCTTRTGGCECHPSAGSTAHAPHEVHLQGSLKDGSTSIKIRRELSARIRCMLCHALLIGLYSLACKSAAKGYQAVIVYNPAASSPDKKSAVVACHGLESRIPTIVEYQPYQLPHNRPNSRGAWGCLREHRNDRGTRTFKDDDDRPRSVRSKKRSL